MSSTECRPPLAAAARYAQLNPQVCGGRLRLPVHATPRNVACLLAYARPPSPRSKRPTAQQRQAGEEDGEKQCFTTRHTTKVTTQPRHHPNQIEPIDAPTMNNELRGMERCSRWCQRGKQCN